MKTTLRDLLRLCHERTILLSVKEGELLVNGVPSKVNPLIPALQEWKPVLLVLFTTYSREEIPQSFWESPCYRCGKYGDVRRDEEGRWLDACYFDLKYGLNPVYWRKAIQETLTQETA